MLDLTPYEKQLKPIFKESKTVGCVAAIALAIHQCFNEDPPSSEADLVNKVVEALAQDVKDTFGENTIPMVIAQINKGMSDLMYGKESIQQLAADQELPQ